MGFSYFDASPWMSFFTLEMFFLRASKSLEVLLRVAFKVSSCLSVDRQKLHIHIGQINFISEKLYSPYF